jgi:hypothetical protein
MPATTAPSINPVNELCRHCNELNSGGYDVIIEKDIIKNIALVAYVRRYDDEAYTFILLMSNLRDKR